MRPQVTVTGGCAKNLGLLRALARIINAGERTLPKDKRVVIYIKSSAMIEAIKQAKAATTRPRSCGV
jgi:hypothetical protein